MLRILAGELPPQAAEELSDGRARAAVALYFGQVQRFEDTMDLPRPAWWALKPSSWRWTDLQAAMAMDQANLVQALAERAWRQSGSALVDVTRQAEVLRRRGQGRTAPVGPTLGWPIERAP